MIGLRQAIAACAIGLWTAGAGLADDMVDSVVRQLRTQGYSTFVVERTLLGRIRIEAQGRNGEREIVLNRRTGEILRDYREVDDDDHDDDSDDDKAEDNSGSGSSNSGRGSGNSGRDDDDNDDGEESSHGDDDDDGDSDGDDSGGDGDDDGSDND